MSEVVAFLRAIRPPLSQLDAALAALPDSGIRLAHLRCVVSADASQADRTMLFGAAASALRIDRPADRLAFVTALLALAPRGASGSAGLLL
jgi:hypothetical protein